MKKITTNHPLTHGFINKRKKINYRWMIIFLLTLLCKLSWDPYLNGYSAPFTKHGSEGSGSAAMAMNDPNGEERSDTDQKQTGLYLSKVSTNTQSQNVSALKR